MVFLLSSQQKICYAICIVKRTINARKFQCYNTNMIGFIRGKVLEMFKSGKSVSSLVIWTGRDEDFGLAYTVLVSEIQVSAFTTGDIVSLWTYAVHNENDNYLIGFDSVKKMRLFLSMLDVSGVGPKTAMQIVDTVGVDGIAQALATNDVKIFSKVPGVGQKTAAKIVLELSGKDLDVAAVLKPQQIDVSEYSDVIATLQKLGYTSTNARDAVAKASAELAMQPTLSTAEKVKLVLSK